MEISKINSISYTAAVDVQGFEHNLHATMSFHVFVFFSSMTADCFTYLQTRYYIMNWPKFEPQYL